MDRTVKIMAVLNSIKNKQQWNVFHQWIKRIEITEEEEKLIAIRGWIIFQKI